jgi:hypothetical protein
MLLKIVLLCSLYRFFVMLTDFIIAALIIFYDIVILLALVVLYMITIHYLKQQQLKSFKIPVLRKC